MKWGNIALCGLLLCVALCAWSQDSQDAGSALPTPSESSGIAPLSSWSELDQLLNQLSEEAQNLNADSEQLQALLDQARLQLMTLSSKLEESRMQANALSTSLELSAKSLQTSAESLNKERQSLNLELWAWRGIAVVSLAVAIIAVW